MYGNGFLQDIFTVPSGCFAYVTMNYGESTVSAPTGLRDASNHGRVFVLIQAGGQPIYGGNPILIGAGITVNAFTSTTNNGCVVSWVIFKNT